MINKTITVALSVMISLMMLACVHAVSLVGEVKLSDAAPQLKPIKVTKDQDYCGDTLPNEVYLIDSNGGLKNVVVFVESAPPVKPADPQKELDSAGHRSAGTRAGVWRASLRETDHRIF